MKNVSTKFKFYYVLSFFTAMISMIAMILLFSVLFIFTSCNPHELRQENSNITFAAFITPSTKATTPFKAGNKAMIHAYNANDLKTPLVGTPSLATAKEDAGVTSLVTAESVNLLKGTYDFYCVSTNTATDPGITFTNGMSSVLSNNVDYLYANNKSVVVSGNTTVPLMLYHKATQLTLMIEANTSQNITDLVIKEVSLKLPATTGNEGKMDFLTGEITPVTSFSNSYTELTENENKYSYIILPVSKSPNSEKLLYQVRVDMTVSGTKYTDRIYNIEINVPDEGLVSGKHYSYTGLIGVNDVTFTPAVVVDWVEETLSTGNGTDICEDSAEEDFYYIKKVYKTLGQPFNEAEESLSSWPGITLSNGRITEINLIDGTLSGTLSPYLAKIRQLIKIDVSGNNLTGNIPKEVSTLPLTTLRVCNNDMSGEVPTEIAEMPLWNNTSPQEDVCPQKTTPLHGFYTYQFEIDATAIDNTLDISAAPFSKTNIKINWGDGQIETYSADPPAHTYSTPGTYVVMVTGKITYFAIQRSNVLKKILKFTDVNNTLKKVSFANSSLKSIECPLITPAVTEFTTCFYLCENLTNLPSNLFKYNTAVTSFSNCFYGCYSLTSLPIDLFKHNTAVTNFYCCFDGCYRITNTPNSDFELWERQGKLGYPVKVDGRGCFVRCSSLPNYSTIPTDWKSY